MAIYGSEKVWVYRIKDRADVQQSFCVRASSCDTDERFTFFFFFRHLPARSHQSAAEAIPRLVLEVRALEQERDQVLTERARLSDDLQDLKAQAASARSEVQRARAEGELLTQQRERFLQDKDAAVETLAKQEAALRDERSRLEALRAELDRRQRDLDSGARELDSERSRALALRDSLSKEEGRIAEVAAHERHLTEVESSLEDRHRAFELAVREHYRREEALSREAQRLEGRSKEVEEEAARVKAEQESMAKDRARQEELRLRLQDQIRVLEAELGDATARVGGARREEDDLRLRLRSLRTEVQAASEEQRKVAIAEEAAKRSLRDAREAAERSLGGVRSEVAAVREQYDQALRELEDARRERDRHRTLLEEERRELERCRTRKLTDLDRDRAFWEEERGKQKAELESLAQRLVAEQRAWEAQRQQVEAEMRQNKDALDQQEAAVGKLTDQLRSRDSDVLALREDLEGRARVLLSQEAELRRARREVEEREDQCRQQEEAFGEMKRKLKSDAEASLANRKDLLNTWQGKLECMQREVEKARHVAEERARSREQELEARTRAVEEQVAGVMAREGEMRGLEVSLSKLKQDLERRDRALQKAEVSTNSENFTICSGDCFHSMCTCS